MTVESFAVTRFKCQSQFADEDDIAPYQRYRRSKEENGRKEVTEAEVMAE